MADASGPEEQTALLLSEAREELVRADTKSTLLLASTGVVIGALISGLIAGNWSPYELRNRIEWLWWIGVTASGVAVTLLAAAVYPRTAPSGRRRGAAFAYYGDVALCRSPEEVESALRGTSSNAMTHLSDQLYQVSKIVMRKYCLIRVAMWLLLLSSGTTLLAVVFNGSI
jgi:hypothetical protein